MYLHEDTKRAVDTSTLRISGIIAQFQLADAPPSYEVDVVLTTRVGRLRTCRLTIERHDTVNMIWTIKEGVPQIFLKFGVELYGDDDADMDSWDVVSPVIAPFRKATPWSKQIHRFDWRPAGPKRRSMKGPR